MRAYDFRIDRVRTRRAARRNRDEKETTVALIRRGWYRSLYRSACKTVRFQNRFSRSRSDKYSTFRDGEVRADEEEEEAPIVFL